MTVPKKLNDEMTPLTAMWYWRQPVNQSLVYTSADGACTVYTVRPVGWGRIGVFVLANFDIGNIQKCRGYKKNYKNGL